MSDKRTVKFIFKSGNELELNGLEDTREEIIENFSESNRSWALRRLESKDILIKLENVDWIELMEEDK